jgi:hypothetical protein
MLRAVRRIKDSDGVTHARKLKGEQAPQQACASNANLHDFDKLSSNGWVFTLL